MLHAVSFPASLSLQVCVPLSHSSPSSKIPLPHSPLALDPAEEAGDEVGDTAVLDPPLLALLPPPEPPVLPPVVPVPPVPPVLHPVIGTIHGVFTHIPSPPLQ